MIGKNPAPHLQCIAMHKLAKLDPETLLSAYAQGVFPMADRDGSIRWYTAEPRGIIPLDTFHIPSTLKAKVRQNYFDVRINQNFEQTMRSCMSGRADGTWINDDLIVAYVRLHRLGFAHSVEAWREGEMAGGLYGVTLGAAFFGESMFHRQRDASKVALVHLVNRLRERQFELLDTQASTPHLRQFGCVDIPSDQYLQRVKRAISKQRTFAGNER
jgi:leucyl/phenylalanyl-tRNA---protein transferase